MNAHRKAAVGILARRIAGFRRDNSGIAAIEFAMIAPLMLLMFFGMLDLSNGFAVDRKVSQIAQSMSDLTSRYTAVLEADITNFFTIGDAMLTPYDKTQLKATISQIYLDPSSKTAKVVWSRGDEKKAKNAVVSVPADLVTKDSNGNWVSNQYLILGEVNYNYQPTIGWVVPKAGVTLNERSFTKPRQMTCVMMGTDCAPSGG
ncbi:pilus assembly protein [Tardiphaga alba]|uniref:Pilus assembly protein n=1 Tax=Tardiphaga alba TaxID=340268 RepID=A0ABX8AD44_9BRAD|nr:TadE/TadG family type IV pilus assembly protein [Tardiphaga alba]QUS41447.1 pilus assembly protein [Tardiphaga alba]